MQTRALRGRADVQADEPRPCRRCMAAVSISVHATMYNMHRSQVIRCLCIGSSLDVRARGYTHGSTSEGARPLTSPSPQCSGLAGYTQVVLTRCKQKPFLAVIVIASHDSRGTSTRARSTARSHRLTTGFFCAATSGMPMRVYVCMIDMTSRTGSIAIWPSCIKFGSRFGPIRYDRTWIIK